jgi:N-acetylglucosamine-6-sulfatase
LVPSAHRPARLATAAVIACVGLALGLRGADEPAIAKAKPSAPKPNVVVIETDDQTQASISVMPKTRSLVGGQGVTFANSFVNHSLCCPSRATMLTGQYSHNHGVRSNNPPLGGFDRLDSSNTLPLWLQGAGYYTGEIGKYLNGYAAHRSDPGGPLLPAGWSEFHGITNAGYYGLELNENGVLNSYGSETENPDNPADPGSYSTDLYTAKAVDFVNRRAPEAQPFFLWLTYNAPHGGPPDPPGNHCFDTAKPALRDLHAFDATPLPTPPSFNEADVSDKPPTIEQGDLDDDDTGGAPNDIEDITRFYRCRLASLLAVDSGVEQVYNALRGSGELDNTLVIFTSDNGFMHGEHRIRTGKIVPYEESIRVPLMIRGPGFRGGKTVRDLAVNADVPKTIVKATRAHPGLTLDGIDLHGFAEQPGRELGRELSIESNAFSGVRTERYVYLEYASGKNAGFQELYDLRNDPYELQNVANATAFPQYAAARAALGARLTALRACTGDACRRAPHLRTKLRLRHGPGGCALPKVRERVRGASLANVTYAEFYVNGKRVAKDRKRPFERKLPFRKLQKKRIAKTRVLVDLVDGREMTIDRNLRACR